MEAGQDPEAFWRLTPREIDAVLRGAAARARREDECAAWTAWHIAALVRWPAGKNAKPFPKLEALLGGPAEAKRERTPDEIEAALRCWLEGGNTQ